MMHLELSESINGNITNVPAYITWGSKQALSETTGTATPVTKSSREFLFELP
jgi:hypothetical protein